MTDIPETGTDFWYVCHWHYCVNVLVASRLGRRPKRLKEMQLAAAAAVSGGGNMSAPSCPSSTDHLEMSSAAMRRLCMSSSTVNSSLDVADVHAELQVLYCYAASMRTSLMTLFSLLFQFVVVILTVGTTCPVPLLEKVM